MGQINKVIFYFTTLRVLGLLHNNSYKKTLKVPAHEN